MNDPQGKYGKFIPTMLWLADLVVVNILFLIVVLIHPDVAHSKSLRLLWVLVTMAYLPMLIWVTPQKMQTRTFVAEHIVSRSIVVVVIHALVFIVLLSFLKIAFPLTALLQFYGMMLIAIPVWSVFSRHLLKVLRKKGYNFLRVVVVGAGPTSRRLIEEMKSNAGFGLNIVGVFSDQPHSEFPYKITGPLSALEDFVKKEHVDQIYYTIAGENERLITNALRVADENMIEFFYVPLIARRIYRSFDLHNIGSVPVLSVRNNKLSSVANQVLKRSFDIAFSGLFLLFSPILFIPIAVAIKLSSPGPIFFVQERTGYRGKTFKCLKFRTMRVNKDADTKQATRDDDRTTKVGAFLRRTSLDELPQFINVFIGDMSVVGPRPHMLKHTDQYSKLVDLYMVRHVVKPGVTGWAQVNGYRGLTDELWKMQKRVEFDVWYIENWSFLLDMKIICRTIYNGVAGEENAF